MGASQVPFALQASLADQPPSLIAAQYEVGTALLTLEWDQPLQAETLELATFQVTFGSGGSPRRRNAPGVSFTAGTMQVIALDNTAGALDPVNRLRYFSSATQLYGANGLPVAEFSNFPVTVV